MTFSNVLSCLTNKLITVKLRGKLDALSMNYLSNNFRSDIFLQAFSNRQLYCVNVIILEKLSKDF